MNMSEKQEIHLEEHLKEDHYALLARHEHSSNQTRSETESSKNEPQIEKLSSRLKIYPNSEFEGNNEEESFIGSGNFSVVLKYHHKDLGTVAIKQFKITGSAKTVQKAWEMVQREANVLCRFQHPNIVKILGVTKWLTDVGIIMEYVDGGGLKDLIEDSETNITWSTRLQIALGLISALTYIHNYKKDKMICHGDLKPENILLTKTQEVKLADFGSAFLHQATGASATTLDIVPSKQHTLLYAAPEVLKNLSGERKPAIDIYSFGIVLYELITRRAPYYDCLLRAALPELITAGNKPNMELIDQVENRVDSSEDKSDFNFLKNMMERCWNYVPSLRPRSKTVETEIKHYMKKNPHQSQFPDPPLRGNPPVESFEETTLNEIENPADASSRGLLHTEDDIPVIVDEHRLSSFQTFLYKHSIPWNSLFEVDVKVRYGETEMDHFRLDLSSGKRLSYGNAAMQERFVSIMEPETSGLNCTPVEMPSYNGGNKKVKEVLDKTGLDFTLTVDHNAVLHVTRLCRSQIYYFEIGSNASTSAVKLERYKRVELFSYKKFVDELLEQKRDSITIRPDTEIRLFIGAKPRSPSSRGIVCVTIEPAAVERIYEKKNFF